MQVEWYTNDQTLFFLFLIYCTVLSHAFFFKIRNANVHRIARYIATALGAITLVSITLNSYRQVLEIRSAETLLLAQKNFSFIDPPYDSTDVDECADEPQREDVLLGIYVERREYNFCEIIERLAQNSISWSPTFGEAFRVPNVGQENFMLQDRIALNEWLSDISYYNLSVESYNGLRETQKAREFRYILAILLPYFSSISIAILLAVTLYPARTEEFTDEKE